MGFIARAIKNATRRLSKSVLLMITFFVIGNFVIIGLGVSNASESAKVLTRQKMKAIVEYKIDYQKQNEYFNSLTEEEREELFKSNDIFNLDSTILDELVKDDRIKAYNMGYTFTTYEEENIKAVPVGNERENDGPSMCGYQDEDGNYIQSECSQPAFMTRLEMSPNIIDFADGIFVLKEGRLYTQEDIDNASPVCLITDKLAEFNNLKVGDTFTFYNTPKSEISRPYNAWMNGDESFLIRELEIIGIYDNTNEIDPNSDEYQWMQKFQSPENLIIYPYTATRTKDFEENVARWEYNKIQNPDEEYFQNPDNAPKEESFRSTSSATLLLHDPLLVNEFVEDYEALESREYAVFDANNDTFNKLSKPLDTMSLFANLIVWLVIINAAIIITLVTALTLKTREYEIGVLLSMGVSKAKIVGQFFVELAIIAIIGFSLAVLSGSLMAKQVGNTVLEYQVSVSDVDDSKNDNGAIYWGETNYFTEITLDDIISEYEVTISPLIIAEIYIAGISIVLVSILIPSLMIMRFNPKRILMNTN